MVTKKQVAGKLYETLHSCQANCVSLGIRLKSKHPTQKNRIAMQCVELIN